MRRRAAFGSAAGNPRDSEHVFAYKSHPMSHPESPAVIAEGLCASFGSEPMRVPVLVDVTFEIPRGQVTAVMGPSGSGKTTLLSLLGGLDRPQSGRLVVDGQDLTTLDRAGLDEFRRRRVGFIFQSFNLLPSLTARENVMAGLEPLSPKRADALRKADEALDAVGLLALANRFPHEMSGGEQQRVAVARACAKDAPLLLADEPTGNLDDEASEQVLDLLVDVSGRRAGHNLIVVTHDPRVAARADARLELQGHQVRTA